MNPDSTSDQSSTRPSGEPEDGYSPEPSSSSFGSPAGSYRPGFGAPADTDAEFDEPPLPAPTQPPPYDDLFSQPLLQPDAPDAMLDQGRAPSLPIILISAACGVAGAVIGMYLSNIVLDFGIVVSAGFTTLGLLFGLGISGAALTAITGERGALINMAFSCTLIALMVMFMTLCAVAGAAIATLLVRA